MEIVLEETRALRVGTELRSRVLCIVYTGLLLGLRKGFAVFMCVSTQLPISTSPLICAERHLHKLNHYLFMKVLGSKKLSKTHFK